MKRLLRLYVTGRSARSLRAIEKLTLLREDLEGDVEFEIIDVLEHPEFAEDDNVLATPTLIRLQPLPIRKIVGDLGDREKVLEVLVDSIGMSRRAESPLTPHEDKTEKRP